MSVNTSNYDKFIAQGHIDNKEDAEADAKNHLDDAHKEAAADKFEEAANHLKEYEEYTGKSKSREINRLKNRAAELRQDLKNEQQDGNPDNVEFGDATADLRQRVEAFKSSSGVGWEDIGGLEETKNRICHEIGLGAADGLPEAAQPSDGVLLFGPPGTGKTLLASAIANGTDTTFFNVKIGGILSKWQGESSQLVSTLFAVAREHTPAVIFIDEIDALTQARGGSSDSANRKVLDSLLTELDGIEKNNDDFLMVIGSTNRPMDLDNAVVRRFDTRIHVPLPDIETAAKIVRIHTEQGGVEFTGHPEAYTNQEGNVPESIAHAIAEKCVQRGFTGSDIESLCNKAVSGMIHEQNPQLAEKARSGLDDVEQSEINLRPIKPKDIRSAFSSVSASVPESSVREYEEWADKFGTK